MRIARVALMRRELYALIIVLLTGCSYTTLSRIELPKNGEIVLLSDQAHLAYEVWRENRLVLKANNAINGSGVGVSSCNLEASAPNILQVNCSSRHPGNWSISIADQGTQIFGVWEHSFGNGLDNRGLSEDFGPVKKDAINLAQNVRAPFFFSKSGYAVYVPGVAFGKFRFGRDGQHTFESNQAALSYYVILGDNPREILASYSQLSGTARVPPAWAMGPLLWRNDPQHLTGDSASPAIQVKGDLESLAKLGMTAGAYILDRPYDSSEYGFGNLDLNEKFGPPADFSGLLVSANVQLMIWAANQANGRIYEEALARGILLPQVREKKQAIDLSSVSAR